METHSTDKNEAIILSNKQLSEMIIRIPQKNLDAKYKQLQKDILKLTSFDCLQLNSKKTLSRFFSNFRKKWEASNRKKERFFSANNAKWLNVKFQFLKKKTNVGRKVLSFDNYAARTKRLRTQKMRNSTTPQELAYALQMQFRAQGQIHASKMIMKIHEEPNKAKEYFHAINETKYSKLNGDEALSLVIEAQLTKFQYKFIRSQAKSKNCDIYPSYDEVLCAKKRCYPEDILITEEQASVPLQSLLNHTCERLIEVQKDVIKCVAKSKNKIKLTLFCKYGFDGTSGQSEYKQRFQNSLTSDSSIFFTSFVPIRLVNNEDNALVWQNSRPASTRFCCPIKVHFSKETTILTLQEKQNLALQIDNLVPFIGFSSYITIEINFEMYLTMIDVKVGNALAENNSTQKCFLCGATSKDFNNIEIVLKRPVLNKAYLKYGLSTLHAWIRFFECLLHLSYKIEIKKWQARQAKDKEKVAHRKKYIQEQLHLKLGLIVDKPKHGFGSSNDGNTARKFFENSTVVADILQVNYNLMFQFHIILQTLSSGYDIDVQKFKEYCVETANLFCSLYPWYPMPTSVHRILIHSSEVLNSFLVPIGQLSEEAQEARNKDIKKFRCNFSRKTSREDNLTDIFFRLLVSSDPIISSFRKTPSKSRKSLLPQSLNLLKSPNVGFIEKDFIGNESSSDDDDE